MAQGSREANPSKIVSLSFLGAILTGTLFLMLPFSSSGEPLNFIDALFMATSATCVTGLTIINIGTELTPIGQMIILICIQIGGLGIMTFSLFFFLAAGKTATLASKMTVVGSLSRRTEEQKLLRALFFIFVMTFVIEGIGAVILYPRLQMLESPSKAMFSSIFHAVSAFCNAGFGLYPDSLMPFQKDFVVPGVVMGLIVLGGIGFVVIDEVKEFARSFFSKQAFRWSLHTKVVLAATLCLILFGTALIWLLEYDNTLKNLPPVFQFWNALFQSVTPRTAGFNTVDISMMYDATLYFVMMLMFIGAAPGSTAGGIKVTTFAVLLAVIKSQAKGQEMTSIFKRKIPVDVIGRALAIFAAAFILVNFITFLLQITERASIESNVPHMNFLGLFFETVSAFGTVGLSTGVTPYLSDLGKLLITFTMFLGRIGPITFALGMIARRRKQVHFEYAEEDVMIG